MSPNNSSSLKQRPVRTRRRRHDRDRNKPRAVLSTTVSPVSTELAWQEVVVVRPKKRHLAVAPLVIAPAGNRSHVYRMIKRAMDIFAALALLVLISPVLLTVLAVLTITTKGRPIFAQERVGHLGKPFRLYKLRTMRLDAEQLRHQVKNEKDGPIFKNQRDPRITRIGRLLRRSSLDETPQLFNVLRGDMSLVGPRPPLAAEVAEYEPWQRIRLAVKPGLTCLWQVSGRSEIAFYRWMLMDAWYVRHQGLWTDVKLLTLTPWAVLSRKGAY